MNYPNPFITERADPFVTKGDDGYYYFTASYPANQNVDNGYDRIILRKSKTVLGLASAEEKAIWYRHDSGAMGAHIWAPELHKIDGVWYIFFAAGDREDVWHIRPYMLKCLGDDPMNDKFEELGAVKAMKDDKLSFSDFSLDMTHFEHNSKHYLIWAEYKGDSVLMMAEIDPKNPTQLTSHPIIISKPEYDWELVRFRVNEGPSVLKLDDKIVVFFSASGTGPEYCMGMLWANKNDDLMDTKSWHKLDKPVMSTADLQNEVGPGHNSFVVDENGEQLIVYHSRPSSHMTKDCGTYCDESLYDPCRHARIKKISFNGAAPIFK